MKALKYTDTRKAFIIRQTDVGTSVAEVCRKAGISQATFFSWRKKHAGLIPSAMRRLRELEQETARLMKIVADLALDRPIGTPLVRETMARAFIEAFNGRFRAECLNIHWLMYLADAAEKMEAWPLQADCCAIACRAMTETTTRTVYTARSGTTSGRSSRNQHTQPARAPDRRAETLTTAEGTLGGTSQTCGLSY